MATRMRWTPGLIGMCVVAGAVIVTRAGDPLVRDQRNLRLMEVSNELNVTARELLEYATYDTVRSYLPDSAGVRLELRAPMPPGWRPVDPWGRPEAAAAELNDTVIDVLRRAVDAELREMGGSRARLAMVALHDVGEALPFGHSRTTLQYHAGRDSLGSWCAVVISVYTDDEWQVLRQMTAGGSVLGPCRLWARYGAPGAGVAAWLPEGGHLLGARYPSEPDPQPARRAEFGIREPVDADVLLGTRAQGCLAGWREQCLPAVLDEMQWQESFWMERSSAGPALLARSPHARGGGPIEHVFADLEEELGSERFAAFWRSDESAEGTLDGMLEAGLADWLVDWGQARFGVEPRGPRIDAGNFVITVLGVLLMLVLSVGVARRRTIG